MRAVQTLQACTKMENLTSFSSRGIHGISSLFFVQKCTVMNQVLYYLCVSALHSILQGFRTPPILRVISLP